MPITQQLNRIKKRGFFIFAGGALTGAALLFGVLLAISLVEERNAEHFLADFIANQAENFERQRFINGINALSWALVPLTQGNPTQNEVNGVLSVMTSDYPEWTFAGDAIEHMYNGTISAEPSSAHPGWIDLRVTNLPETLCVYLQRNLRPAANEIGTGDSFTNFKPEGSGNEILSSIVGCQQERNTVNFRIGLN
jgi:hypothetical protein